MRNEKSQQSKGRQQLIFVTALFLLPPISAWLVWQYMQTYGVTSTSNTGELIHPARPLPQNALVTVDHDEIQQLRGHWYLTIFTNDTCNESCKKQLYLTRQVRLRTNKDVQRIKRLLISEKPLNKTVVQTLMQQHADLTIAQVKDQEIGKQWKTQFSGKQFSPNGSQFFIVDPLGNLIMHYDAEVEPKHLLKDIKKLLKASQIG